MGTINSKWELWPENAKRTWKTVLKTKSVYTRMMVFFKVQFWTRFNNGSENEFSMQNCAKKTLKTRSVDTRTMVSFYGQFSIFLKNASKTQFLCAKN